MQSTYVPDNPVHEFLELLTALGRRNSLRDPVANLIAESGMGSAQVHALMWLKRDGPLTMGVLAQRIGVTDKTVTGVVDRMERDAFVTRERNADDRRVVQVVLAPKGRELADELHTTVVSKVGVFLGLLDDRDRTDLFRILHNIGATIDRHQSSVSPASTP